MIVEVAVKKLKPRYSPCPCCGEHAVSNHSVDDAPIPRTSTPGVQTTVCCHGPPSHLLSVTSVDNACVIYLQMPSSRILRNSSHTIGVGKWTDRHIYITTILYNEEARHKRGQSSTFEMVCIEGVRMGLVLRLGRGKRRWGKGWGGGFYDKGKGRIGKSKVESTTQRLRLERAKPKPRVKTSKTRETQKQNAMQDATEMDGWDGMYADGKMRRR
jgi:hypothetical protein